MAEYFVDKKMCMDALTLQAPLHIGDCYRHRVDGAGFDFALEGFNIKSGNASHLLPPGRHQYSGPQPCPMKGSLCVPAPDLVVV